MFASSFNGRIVEIPGISVDNFEEPAELRCRAYFLSHCHTDHTKGLHTVELLRTLEETNALIYMSEPSAAIIEDEATFKDIMNYVKPLPLGIPTTITLPSRPSDTLQETSLQVTLIPAGHCFGSVMFLFCTKTRTVLFTGDFRINRDDLQKYASFYDQNGRLITLDALYMDTTFLTSKHVTFPRRSESIRLLVDEVETWLRGQNHRVALHVSARYGYEYVYNEIYEQLKLKTYVSDARWRFYSKLQSSVPGVTNDSTSRLHLCTNWNEHMSHQRCLPDCNEDWKFLYIHFSAKKWEDYKLDERSVIRLSEKRLDVCFSTHCSRSELVHFKNYLNPKKVVGFPNEYVEKSPLKEGSSPLKGRSSPLKGRSSPLKGRSSPLKRVSSPLKKVSSPLKEVSVIGMKRKASVSPRKTETDRKVDREVLKGILDF